MINLKNAAECCGCTACESICPCNAITMFPDDLGFLYPVINTELCVQCGLCEKVCPLKNKTIKNTPLAYYGVQHNNIQEVKTSRSGAAFIAFSDCVLNNGGVVYGAAFNNKFLVTHKRASNKEECKVFKNSKYIQSSLTGIFQKVKEDLHNGLKVLISGTPCQIAGLKHYIPVELQKNLYTIDLVCHGVSSPNVWISYIEHIKSVYKKDVQEANFRDKAKGWDSHYESFVLSNGKKIIRRTFADLFYKNLINRDCCAVCPFASIERVGDISLADFWNNEKLTNLNKDNVGISLCIISTQKGEKLFENALQYIHTFQVDISNCIQPNMIHPTEESVLKPSFIFDYTNKDFMFVLKKYGEYNLKSKLGRIKYNIQLAITGRKKISEIFDIIYR